MNTDKFTIEQLQIADEIDAMDIGQTIDFNTGVTVKRESPERYIVNDDLRPYCFIEAWQKTIGAR